MNLTLAKNTSQGIEDTAAGRRALNDYIAGGKAMAGQGMIGSASADAARQEMGISPVDIERLRRLGKGGHRDLTTIAPKIAPKADEIWMEPYVPPMSQINSPVTETQIFPASTDPDEIFYPPDMSPEELELLNSAYRDPQFGYKLKPSSYLGYEDEDEAFSIHQ